MGYFLIFLQFPIFKHEYKNIEPIVLATLVWYAISLEMVPAYCRTRKESFNSDGQ